MPRTRRDFMNLAAAGAAASTLASAHAGAKWFGYPTYWANRAGAPADTLGASADAIAVDLSGLETFVGS